MPLPSGFLDELRARLTLSEVVGRKVRLTRAGREFKACCPFHKEKSASFTVNDQKGFYHCFGCGAHGDVVGFIIRSENRSFMEAVETLAGLAGMEVPKSSPEETRRYEQEKNLYTLIEEATKWFEEQLHMPHGRTALHYIKGRGLADETLHRFRLGFAPADGQALIKYLSGKGYKPEQMIEAGLAKKSERDESLYSFFRGRLIFPVQDRRGRVVAFGARLLEGDGPKYINSGDHSLFHKGQLLYGFSHARAAAAEGKPLIITEGYMDVIRLHEAGFTGAVAPLGTALTEEQILALWKIIPKPPVRPDLNNHIPILCLDGDVAGQRAAERALSRILPHLGPDQSVRFAMMVAGEDPDSLIKGKGPAAMQAVLDAAMPLVDYLWQATAAGRPLNTPEDRAGFRRALEARMAEIKDAALKQDYRETIQKRIAENFGAAPAQAPTAFSKRGGPWKGRIIGPIVAPRPLPGNLQERITLAILINHPALFHEMEDALHNLPLSDAGLDTLLHAVFTFMGEPDEAHDSAAALRDYLEKNGHGALLNRLISPSLYVHAAFAHPDKPPETARAAWQDIWHHHQRSAIEDELRKASLELNDENMARISELQAMLAELDAQEEARIVANG